MINVNKNAAYPKAIEEIKEKEELSKQIELRQNKYLNNRVEQDHRFISQPQEDPRYRRVALATMF